MNFVGNITGGSTIEPAGESKTDAGVSFHKKYVITSAKDLKDNVEGLTKIDPTIGILCVIVAVFATISFILTYNSLSGIDDHKLACAESDELSNELKIQAIVLLVVGICVLIAGLVLIFVAKGSKISTPIGVIAATVGMLSLIYAVAIAARKETITLRMTAALAALGGSVGALAILIYKGKDSGSKK